jgi:hypothetical protein
MRMGMVCAALVAAGCGGEIVGPAVYETQSFGDVENGFPNRYERAMFMAANRTRSDPATVKGAQSTVYPAAAPLVLTYDLERSSRFHATMLAKGMAPLMHPSPCTLKSDVGTSGCDGTPACGCASGATCASCGTCAAGTDPGTRIGYFATVSRGWGEIIAAGYGDPWRVMDGWVDEPQGSDGHRAIVTSASYGVVGFGHADGATGACWPNFDGGDFGGDKPAVPKIASAASKPFSGSAGTFRLYATWADPTGGAPQSLRAVVDGACVDLQLELGDPKLNSTWFADVPLSNGCHTVYILGTAQGGGATRYPTATSITIPVGGGACPDSLPQPVASCLAPPPADGGAPAADLGATPLPDLGGPGAPPVDAPPAVSVDSPADGATFAANSPVPLRALASDDHGVASVVASWTRFGYTSQYPLDQTAPGVWTLALTVGRAGDRVFTLTATDDAGQSTTTAPITIHVQ